VSLVSGPEALDVYQYASRALESHPSKPVYFSAVGHLSLPLNSLSYEGISNMFSFDGPSSFRLNCLSSGSRFINSKTSRNHNPLLGYYRLTKS